MEVDFCLDALDEALVRLNNMKREYDRASQIVLQRQSVTPQTLVCWTWENKDDKTKQISKITVAQCKHIIPDAGRAAFTNNGHKDRPGDPNEKIRTIYCCSMACFTAYQQNRPIAALSRH